MNKFLSTIYEVIGISNIFIKSEAEYKIKSYTNIDSIDYLLNDFINKFYYLKKYLLLKNFNVESIVYLIEYASTIFIVLSLVYFISYLKESIKNILHVPTSKINSNFQEVFEELNTKREDNLDNVLFIKNKSTGEYEKFKLIRLLKDLTNLNFNNNNNNNVYERVSSYSNQDSDQSVVTFQSILKSEISKNIESSLDSNTQSLISGSSNHDILKIKSLSMLSQIVFDKNASSSLVQPSLNKNSNIIPNIESEEEIEINCRLKRLNIRRVLEKNLCIFTCITQCLLYLKNEQFWFRYEKKSNTMRPNFQKYESQKDFRMKLRKVVYKFWIKNSLKFLNYLKETAKDCKFKSEEELKLEMKKYLNDGYCNNYDSSLDYTIPCILSTCLQINIILIRTENVIKLTPDILGRIELNSLSNIYLIQHNDSLYESAIEN